MSYFLYNSLEKQKYDNDFVICHIIPKIRNKVSSANVVAYSKVVPLDIPPNTNKCSLSPKIVKQALEGVKYTAKDVHQLATVSGIGSTLTEEVNQVNQHGSNVDDVKLEVEVLNYDASTPILIEDDSAITPEVQISKDIIDELGSMMSTVQKELEQHIASSNQARDVDSKKVRIIQTLTAI